jgi:hypothetical protein
MYNARGAALRGSREGPPAKGYTTARARAHPTHGLPLKTLRALNPGSGGGHAGCRLSSSSPDIDGDGGQGWQALEDVHAVNKTENTCALDV